MSEPTDAMVEAANAEYGKYAFYIGDKVAMRAALTAALALLPDAERSHGEGWFLPRAELNEAQIETLERFLPHAKRACEIDCKIRKDAKETWYELDFIKHLCPLPAPPPAEGGQKG